MRDGKRLLSVLVALAVSGQTAPAASDPVNLIKAQTRAISRDSSGRHSGPAWDALVADGAAAQFFMVGEQHGSGDIARFETALHAELAKQGYTHSALEIGPISTPFAERLIRSGQGELQRYIATPGHGFVLPFLFFSEEAAMAEQMVRTSPDRQQALFGLDQEFVGAGPILVDQLEKAATSEAQLAAVKGLAKAVASDTMLVGKIGDDELAKLDRAFAGNARGIALLEAIRTSARIYRPFIARTGSGYAGNLERETYMKANFVREFEAARERNGQAPKVFFKFGGNHAMRGMSGTNVPALGNFLAEWGLPRNYRMVNVMVDCVGGEALNPQSGKPAPCESYFGEDSAIAKAVAAGSAVQIVDLRALRPSMRKLAAADEASRKMILAFDYYVAIKGGAAATPLGKPTP